MRQTWSASGESSVRIKCVRPIYRSIKDRYYIIWIKHRKTERTGYNVSFAVGISQINHWNKARTLWGQVMRQTRFYYLNHKKVRTCYERAVCQAQSAKGESNKKITHALCAGNKLDIVSTRLRRKLIIGTKRVHSGGRQCVGHGFIIWIITKSVPAMNGRHAKHSQQKVNQTKNHARSLGGEQIRYCQYQVEIGHWNKARTLCWRALRRTRSASTEVRFPRRHVHPGGHQRGSASVDSSIKSIRTKC